MTCDGRDPFRDPTDAERALLDGDKSDMLLLDANESDDDTDGRL